MGESDPTGGRLTDVWIMRGLGGLEEFLHRVQQPGYSLMCAHKFICKYQCKLMNVKLSTS